MVNHSSPTARSLAYLATLSISLVACDGQTRSNNRANESSATTAVDLSEARQRLAAAIVEAVENARQITDSSNLISRLNLADERIRGFDSTRANLDAIRTAVRSGYTCMPGICICDGDADCNDLFSGVCRDPSTGGQCWENGGRLICMCRPRARR